jgi:hypothetical protein
VDLDPCVRGGGGYNVGSGKTNPVSVTSTSVTHDQFFLRNDAGQEMAVELANASLALRKGHQVTVVWGVAPGKERGPYLAVHNPAIGAPVFMDASISELALAPSPWWMPFAWGVSVLAICFYGLGLIALVVLAVRGWNRIKKRTEYAEVIKNGVRNLLQ